MHKMAKKLAAIRNLHHLHQGLLLLRRSSERSVCWTRGLEVLDIKGSF
jgi:hypothetical protein